MASENPSSTPRTPLYPNIDTNPTPSAPPLPSSSSNPNQPSSSLYPTVDLVENLFPDTPHNPNSPYSPPVSVEEVILSVPGAILHLIDKKNSVELACGDLNVMKLRQGNNAIAILARVGDENHEIQWPLTRDEACVKLDQSHYFFSMRAPKENEKDDDMLNYGLTFASKGQDKVLKELDELLEQYSSFSVQKVDEKKGILDATMANEMDPSDLKSEAKKEEMEQSCSAYWSTLAPNVEDYSGTAAKLIAAGSGQLVKGILWCGDVTVERLKWGNEVLKKKMEPGTDDKEVSPETLNRIKRVKKVSKMTEKVAGGILSGVLKVSGYFTSSIVNSKVGKKFFRLMPGEMALATLDGFGKICDAFEVSGKNVMSTSSTVTTELVSYKYGKETAKATNEGLDAAGYAIGAAWTVFKLRQAMNPKSVVKPSALSTVAIKNATQEMKNKALQDVKAKNSSKSSPKNSK